MFSKWLCLSAFLLIATGLGCGGPSGPTTYPLSGTVTYKGSPVPLGSFSLAPDSSKGNKGPGTSGGIKDGKFVTDEGRGHVGGPYIIRVTGYDGVPVEGGEGMDPTGTLLFNEYEMEADLPEAEHSVTVEVP